MRLKDYLSEDIKEFRRLRIGLVKNDTSKMDIISKISEEYALKQDLIDNINFLNNELSKHYKGKFKFDFCLNEDVSIDCLRIKRESVKDIFKEHYIKVNDVFAKAKKELERKLSSDN